MTALLIYHPERQLTRINGLEVYHDNFQGNQDPYIWNDKFLNTYCHTYRISQKIGQVNFWVSGDKFPAFNHLYCDCVFEIAEIHTWSNQNFISIIDKIVDNVQAYEHHYKWVNAPFFQHYWNRTKVKRTTLKAHPERSFQPQRNHLLIDILPFLNSKGILTSELNEVMKQGFNSKPFLLPENIADELYDYLLHESELKLYGNELRKLHPDHNPNTMDEYLQLILSEDITEEEWINKLHMEVEKFASSVYSKQRGKESQGVPVKILYYNQQRKLKGLTLWSLLEPDIHRLLCKEQEIKEWVKEFISGDVRNLAIGIIGTITSTYAAPISIAVPITGLILKIGITNLCKNYKE